MAVYRVKTSSWLMALICAWPLGAVALGLGVVTFFLPRDQWPVGIVVFVCALATGVLAGWMAMLGLRTRHCSAMLTVDLLDVTTYCMDRGKSTRRLASARIPWPEVQCLVTESYDVVNSFGLRWPFRNLYVFSTRGDFIFYGVAWKNWDVLAAEIIERSGRQPDVPATERAMDLNVLNQRMRRSFRVMRVMSWVSVATIALLMVAALLASFD